MKKHFVVKFSHGLKSLFTDPGAGKILLLIPALLIINSTFSQCFIVPGNEENNWKSCRKSYELTMGGSGQLSFEMIRFDSIYMKEGHSAIKRDSLYLFKGKITRDLSHGFEIIDTMPIRIFLNNGTMIRVLTLKKSGSKDFWYFGWESKKFSLVSFWLTEAQIRQLQENELVEIRIYFKSDHEKLAFTNSDQEGRYFKFSLGLNQKRFNKAIKCFLEN